MRECADDSKWILYGSACRMRWRDGGVTDNFAALLEQRRHRFRDDMLAVYDAVP